MKNFIEPTKELKAAVKEWFGVTVQQAVAQGKFLDIMEKLGTVGKEEIGRMIPRIRGLTGVLAVSQNINTVKEYEAEFTKRAGQTQEAYNDQMKSAARQMKIFTAEVREFKNSFRGSFSINRSVERNY